MTVGAAAVARSGPRMEIRVGLGMIVITLLACAILFPAPGQMTNEHLGLLMLVLVVCAIMIGFPAAFTLMGMGVLFALIAFHGSLPQTLNLVVQRVYAIMTNDVLISIPLFVFMGYVVERANLIERLFTAMHILLARVPGALAVATLLTCTLFATATGIIGAIVTVMGLLALPTMLRAGYDTKLACGVIAAGSCLGVLIPPSILLIVYAATAGVSVVRLYAGAIFPGLMLATLYIGYVIVVATIKPKLAPPLPPEQRQVRPVALAGMLAKSFLPLAALILAVLGSIIFGLATPTEAAAIGAAGGIVLALAYRQLSVSILSESVALTAKTSAMVCWLFVGSSIFSAAFALLGGQGLIERWVLSMDLEPWQFMLLAQFVIFLLGWPLDWAEIIVIFVPIFIPLLPHFHIDPLFFGLLVALNLQTAYLSPPVAMAAFYLRGVAPPGVTLNQIFAGMAPFMVIQIFAIALLYLFPQVGLWLPAALYN